MLKSLAFVVALLLAFVARGAAAQTCASWPYPLHDGSTAYGSQVAANFSCAALLNSPHFTGNVGIGTAAPQAPLTVAGQVVIGQPYRGDASLHIVQSYGGFGRLTQMNLVGANAPALNLMASNDANGNQQWWSWGVNNGVWTISPGAVFGAPGLAVDSAGNGGFGGANLTIGAGGPGIVHLFGSTVYDTGNFLHLGSSQAFADGHFSVSGQLAADGIVEHTALGGAYGPSKVNFWWDGTCVFIIVDYTPFPITCPSDRRLKNAVGALPEGSGLSTISKLRPVTFGWSRKDALLKQNVQYGFIAQEVQSVLPDVVYNTGMKTPETPDGLMRLDYNGLIAPIVKAIQELKALNDRQEAEIQTLKAKLAGK